MKRLAFATGFINACANGDVNAVAALLPNMDRNQEWIHGLIWAHQNKHISVVNLIISHKRDCINMKYLATPPRYVRLTVDMIKIFLQYTYVPTSRGTYVDLLITLCYMGTSDCMRYVLTNDMKLEPSEYPINLDWKRLIYISLSTGHYDICGVILEINKDISIDLEMWRYLLANKIITLTHALFKYTSNKYKPITDVHVRDLMQVIRLSELSAEREYVTHEAQMMIDQLQSIHIERMNYILDIIPSLPKDMVKIINEYDNHVNV